MIIPVLDYQNAVAKRLDNRQLLSFDNDAVGQSNLFFLPVFPRYVGVTQTLQSLAHYAVQCVAIYPSEIYHQQSMATTASMDKVPPRASVSSSQTMRSVHTSASAMNAHDEDDLTSCPNINLHLIKRDLPDYQASAGFSLSWYASNTVPFANQSSIYGFYATAKDDLVNIVAVPLDQLLSLYKRCVQRFFSFH